MTSETYWAWSHLGRLTKKCREQVLRCCWPGTCRPPYRQSCSSGFSVRCRIRSTRSSRRHCYAEARRSSATPPDERPHKKDKRKKRNNQFMLSEYGQRSLGCVTLNMQWGLACALVSRLPESSNNNKNTNNINPMKNKQKTRHKFIY